MNTNKPKVLYLPRWYPNRYDPMPGLFIERHARSVAGLAEIAVLYVHPDDALKGKSFETDISRDEELFQVKIYFRISQTGIPGLDSLRNLCRLLKYHRKGLKIIKKEFGYPDLLHVNVLTRLGAIALLYKWFTGTPYVITEHWTRYLPHMDNFKGWLRKRFTRMVVRQAAAVMPVTDNLRKAMERHGLHNSNYVIIPNVVDMNVFEITDIPSGRQKKQIIHVSCFEDRQKNISGILRVLKKLSEKRSDWECHMIGEGIHYDRLVQQAKELGLKEKLVHFHGLKEGAELARMMAEADFQVMFSRFENLPVVILESYACGVPVLSTDVGGIREHLTDELGILIPSENEDKLLEKLDFMLDHYEEYKKEKLRAYAQAHFSKEVIGRQLWEVYTASL
ncbi:MAG: glycosyltransferase [Bacteroidales bacterium]|nr:glycosyltransferase [Bacteroidales bacterium]